VAALVQRPLRSILLSLLIWPNGSHSTRYVSEGELARDAATGFSALDKDCNEKLTPQELGPHNSAWFSRVDLNGDGVLTFSEVMKASNRRAAAV
jgi:hypothetical protein